MIQFFVRLSNCFIVFVQDFGQWDCFISKQEPEAREVEISEAVSTSGIGK